MKETYPGENISPPRIRRTKVFTAIIIVLVLAGSGYLFSLGRKWQTVPAREEATYRFENKALSELCEVIEKRYSVIVTFDRQEVGNYHFTGMLDTEAPLTEFLKKLKTTSGIEYYYDEGGILHFR
ncbi:DUF4974 domain-containing protein [uncultured Chitinophaga sp.]|uniref:DUF4974 domain-containing protein n=1 Tax=uncultured Chitinophaga sp. TaxID=339340 RepID=UPI002601D53F|nr:DUF4974 domain-containing protein [uncultured Chitinophaga sp.]